MLLAQDGFAASDRIENGLQSNVIQGAILSASNRAPSALAGVVSSLKQASANAFILFDPEFYVGSFSEANKFGKLTEYDYFKHPLQKVDLINPTSIQTFVKKVVDVQSGASLSHIVSPTVRIQAFNSASDAHAFSFLFATAEYVKQNELSQDLYGSLLIDEIALTNSVALAEFLDTLTTLNDYKGFYLVIDRSRSTVKFWNNPDTLASLMYTVHSLADNGYSVVVGYSDGDGLLSLATGATHVASGWWGNTTNFTEGKFISSGGRRRKKYYSYQLMNSVYQEGELSLMVEHGFTDRVMKVTDLDAQMAEDPLNEPWPDSTAILHKWKAIDKRVQALDAQDGEEAKLNSLEAAIREAQALYQEIINTIDIEFDVANGPKRLDIWLKAIELYRQGSVV